MSDDHSIDEMPMGRNGTDIDVRKHDFRSLHHNWLHDVLNSCYPYLEPQLWMLSRRGVGIGIKPHLWLGIHPRFHNLGGPTLRPQRLPGSLSCRPAATAPLP